MSAKVTLLGHFKKLFDFRGREDRASFWPYAAVAFIITVTAAMIVFIPMMSRAFEDAQQFAAEHPDQGTISSGPGHYSISIHGNHPELMPGGSIALFLGVTFGLALLLFAAAVVRRLRDTGKSGAWGLMPLPFILYSSILMPGMFTSVGTGAQPDMTLFFSIFFSNLLYMVTLVWLIVLLAQRSEPGPARNGPDV
jgi:uncharacterized membrane protein YhaH (DUF805 family)